MYGILSLKISTKFLPSVSYKVVGERDEVTYTKWCYVIAFTIEIMPGFSQKIEG